MRWTRANGRAATSWPRSPSCWPPHRKRRPRSAASNNAVDDAAGHPARAARACFPAADRVLVTVVYLRQICSQNVLSDLLGINANSIGQAIAETRQLLSEHHRTIRPDHAAVHHRQRAGGVRPPAASPSRRERACPTGSPILP